MNEKRVTKGLSRREAIKIGGGTVVGMAGFGRVRILTEEVSASEVS